MTLLDFSKMFVHVRDKFALTFPEAANVRLKISTAMPPGTRDIAWYSIQQHTIYVYRSQITARSAGCLKGVLWHEFGHAVDKDVDKAGSEKRADRLAKRATGYPVLYTQDGVQHASHGKPGRPSWLHQ